MNDTKPPKEDANDPNQQYPAKNFCTARIEQLALPNVHLVIGVLREHFDTLTEKHIFNLRKLLERITVCNHAERHFEESLEHFRESELGTLHKIIEGHRGDKFKVEKDDDNKRATRLSFKSPSEAYLVVLGFKERRGRLQVKGTQSNRELKLSYATENAHKPLKLRTKKPRDENQQGTPSEVIASHLWETFKARAWSNVPHKNNLTSIPPDDIPRTGNADPLLDVVENSLQGEKSKVDISIVSESETSYTCEAEIKSCSDSVEKSVTIGIRLSTGMSDLSIDCTTNDESIHRHVYLSPIVDFKKANNVIVGLYEAFKKCLWILLNISTLNGCFNGVYLCILSIVNIFKLMCDDLIFETKENDYKAGSSIPRIQRYSRTRRDLFDTFMVNNVCSILS